jgi:hypothetical protein
LEAAYRKETRTFQAAIKKLVTEAERLKEEPDFTKLPKPPEGDFLPKFKDPRGRVSWHRHGTFLPSCDLRQRRRRVLRLEFAGRSRTRRGRLSPRRKPTT